MSRSVARLKAGEVDKMLILKRMIEESLEKQYLMLILMDSLMMNWNLMMIGLMKLASR